jgi:hydroxymethylpyrimidine pyrophosphatase-like HAD family hydrolase
MSIISDLDGTLLSQSGVAPEGIDHVVSAVRALRQNFVVATTRPFADVKRIFGNCKSNYTAILNDGSETVIVDANGDFALADASTLDVTVVDRHLETLVASAMRPFAFLSLSADPLSMVICPPNSADDSGLLQALHPERPYSLTAANEEYNRQVDRYRGGLRALAYFTRNMHTTLLRSRFAADTDGSSFTLLDYAETRCSGYHWLEMAPPNTGKKQAILRLDARGLIPRPWIGLGNGLNDVAFLELCDYSICPSDADPHVRDVVTEIAPEPGGERFCAWLLTALPRVDGRLRPDSNP